jgi:hypothetical protein
MHPTTFYFSLSTYFTKLSIAYWIPAVLQKLYSATDADNHLSFQSRRCPVVYYHACVARSQFLASNVVSAKEPMPRIVLW